MPDVSIVNQSVTSAPTDYTVPGTQELLVKAVRASINGAGAASAYLPALQLLDPAGHVMWTACNPSDSVAAGASADVSWFPSVGGAGRSAQRFIGARIYRSTAQAVTDSTNADFVFDTVAVDTGGMANLASNPKVLTVVTAGFYLVTTQNVWAINATGRRIIALTQNGYFSASSGSPISAQSLMAITDFGGRTNVQTSTIAFLNAGDFVSVGLFQSSGGSLSTDVSAPSSPYQNYLAAALIGVQ